MNTPNEDKRTGFILMGIGIIPVVWAALTAAPFLSEGLMGILEGFTSGMDNPMAITWCADSPRAILLSLLTYGLSIGVYLSTRRNYRKGEEHGSAKWGNAAQIVKKYADKDKMQNVLLTQNTRIGLDGREHRRNLNVMVVGGSGAGKTRFYAKPNIMQARLVATTNAKKHVHVDGTVNTSRIHRYICYNKVRHHALCAGQSGYTASRIDEVIDQLIRKVLYRCKDMPAEPLVKMRCAARIAESEALQKKAKSDMEVATSEMKELQEEVFRVIRGESALPQSVLAEMLKVSERKVTEASKQYMDACESVRDVDRLCNDMSKQIGQLQSWSTLYKDAEPAVKKMIAASLISRVTVSKDYSLDIQFNISYEQFLGEAEKNTIANLA